MRDLTWTCHDFAGLSSTALYKILQARAEVFVVEQHCNYLDPDGIDIKSLHLCAWFNDEIIAYARIIPPGISYEEAGIGRVLVRKKYRGEGFGELLMKKAIDATIKSFSVNTIHISAQYYLLDFYTKLGFSVAGNQYLEDDIPHIAMIYGA